MTTLPGLPISLILWIAIHPQTASPNLLPPTSPAQTPIGFSVSLSMPKVHLSVGEEPKAVVLMTNPDVVFVEIPCDDTVKVHVQGKHGEPPLTEWNRHLHRIFLPGDGPDQSPTTLCAFRHLQPGLDIYRIYDLSRFFDLREPGTYTVFFEVQDPSASRITPALLRTNTVQFEIQTPAKSAQTPPGAR